MTQELSTFVVKPGVGKPAYIVTAPKDANTLNLLQFHAAPHSGNVEVRKILTLPGGFVLDQWFDEEATWHNGALPNVDGIVGPIVYALSDSDGETIGLPELVLTPLLECLADQLTRYEEKQK